MAPYLLTNEPAFSNPAQPQLDRVGAAVLATTLRLLPPLVWESAQVDEFIEALKGVLG